MQKKLKCVDFNRKRNVSLELILFRRKLRRRQNVLATHCIYGWIHFVVEFSATEVRVTAWSRWTSFVNLCGIVCCGLKHKNNVNVNWYKCLHINIFCVECAASKLRPVMQLYTEFCRRQTTNYNSTVESFVTINLVVQRSVCGSHLQSSPFGHHSRKHNFRCWLPGHRLICSNMATASHCTIARERDPLNSFSMVRQQFIQLQSSYISCNLLLNLN